MKEPLAGILTSRTLGRRDRRVWVPLAALTGYVGFVIGLVRILGVAFPFPITEVLWWCAFVPFALAPTLVAWGRLKPLVGAPVPLPVDKPWLRWTMARFGAVRVARTAWCLIPIGIYLYCLGRLSMESVVAAFPMAIVAAALLGAVAAPVGFSVRTGVVGLLLAAGFLLFRVPHMATALLLTALLLLAAVAILGLLNAAYKQIRSYPRMPRSHPGDAVDGRLSSRTGWLIHRVGPLMCYALTALLSHGGASGWTDYDSWFVLLGTVQPAMAMMWTFALIQPDARNPGAFQLLQLAMSSHDYLMCVVRSTVRATGTGVLLAAPFLVGAVMRHQTDWLLALSLPFVSLSVTAGIALVTVYMYQSLSWRAIPWMSLLAVGSMATMVGQLARPQAHGVYLASWLLLLGVLPWVMRPGN